MLAGFGKTEITPPLGTELAGYGYYLQRKSDRIDDPLYARAVAFSEQETLHLVISCDCLGLNRQIAAQVRTALNDQHRVSPEHVIIVSIHTHTGPAVKYHEGCGEVSSAYVATLGSCIISACNEAINDLHPVTGLRFIQNTLERPCAYNRANAALPVDDQARFFCIDRQCESIVMASYACHAVCQGKSTGISADFPGRICEKIEAHGFRAMYVNGLCGDVDPIRCKPEEIPSRLEAFAQTVYGAMQGEGDCLPLTVQSGKVEETLLLAPLTMEDIHHIADAVNRTETDPPGGGKIARVWEREMQDRLSAIGSEERFVVHYMLLGGILIAALPFEGYTETGKLIRRAIGDSRALVLGCADELLGYLPTEDDIDRRSYASLAASFLYKRLPSARGEAERIGRVLGHVFSRIVLSA